MTIAVRQVSKAFGPVQAVADVSFAVQSGEIYGLLGRNGAGKTTTINAIIGLIEPDAGAVEICGADARRDRAAAKKRIGAALQSTGLQPEITPREALSQFAMLYGVPANVEGLIARFGLAEKADAKYATLSEGQKQRLALALAFVNGPAVVVLDEPTAGLDPQMRRALHEQILAMKADGRAVLLATHDMQEAISLCDRVAIIEGGKILAEGPPRTLTAGVTQKSRLVIEADAPLEPAWFAALADVSGIVCEGAVARLSTNNLNAALAAIVAMLNARGVAILRVETERAALEDVMLDLVAKARA